MVPRLNVGLVTVRLGNQRTVHEVDVIFSIYDTSFVSLSSLNRPILTDTKIGEFIPNTDLDARDNEFVTSQEASLELNCVFNATCGTTASHSA